MSKTDGKTCVVCGAVDARLLTATRLSGGAVVTVCGSHELAHLRADAPAATVEELRALLGERRVPLERRGVSDELAGALHLAFSGDRRSGQGGRRLGGA